MVATKRRAANKVDPAFLQPYVVEVVRDHTNHLFSFHRTVAQWEFDLA